MKLFDLHTDTATHLFYRALPFNSPSISASAHRLEDWEHQSRVFAVFTRTHLSDEAGYHSFFAVREHLLDTLPPYVDHLTPYLAVEDARILNGRLERVDELYRAGVAIITPLWRGLTVIGGAFDTNAGLTDFGRCAIQRMQELGIVVDVSHASDNSFCEIAEIAELNHHPILATHSNSRAVHPHPRNLTNEQFCAVRASGGLVGLSFCPEHLSDSSASSRNLLLHLEHYLALGGEDTVAFGTDFDGIERTPIDLKNVTQLLSFADQMAQLGYSDALISKLFYKNAEDFFGKHCIKKFKRQETL